DRVGIVAHGGRGAAVAVASDAGTATCSRVGGAGDMTHGSLAQDLDTALDELVLAARMGAAVDASTSSAHGELAVLLQLAATCVASSAPAEVGPGAAAATRRRVLEGVAAVGVPQRRSWRSVLRSVRRRPLALVLLLVVALALPTFAVADTDTGAGRV